MGLVRAQFEGTRKGDTKRVPASPSRCQPGSAAPQRRRSSRPKRTPRSRGAASSPWVHRRGHPPPARAPDSSPPSLRARCRRLRAPAAAVPRCPGINRAAGKRAPPSEGGGRGCGAVSGGRRGVQNGACARSARGAARQCASVGPWRRRALRGAGGRRCSSSAPLHFLADSSASGSCKVHSFAGLESWRTAQDEPDPKTAGGDEGHRQCPRF